MTLHSLQFPAVSILSALVLLIHLGAHPSNAQQENAKRENGSRQSVSVVANALDDEGITQAEFERLFREVNTPSDAPWRQIPWKISLLDAQNSAAQSKKPIFIWAMDGHPLGCT